MDIYLSKSEGHGLAYRGGLNLPWQKAGISLLNDKFRLGSFDVVIGGHVLSEIIW